MEERFDTSLADSQGTSVQALSPKAFDLQAYCDYEAELLEGCNNFWKSPGGIAVYRRFRVPEVFSWACADRKLSLELQLGALKKSMAYKADIPNFLEPWYGIGVVASAFGIPYIWNEGQAPAVESSYKTAKEVLAAKKGSVAESPAGKHVLETIEYFLDKTKGMIPVSLSDTQSPLNIVSSYLMDSSSFMYEIYDHPEELKTLLLDVAEMEADFLRVQQALIGEVLVKPGHGFASARCFDGVGFSDDNILMFSDEVYEDFAIPSLLKAAEGFAGPVFHSCGDWSWRAELVKRIPGLLMADAAVGKMTDPSPNNLEMLAQAFSESEVILHTRIVGSPETIRIYAPHLRNRKLKTIIATYCQTPAEQEEVYTLIHQEH